MALHRAEHGTRSAPLAAGAPVFRVLVFAVLAGCVAEQAAAPPAPPAPAARAANEGFFFDQDGTEARLAYGRANSDDVRLMLRCETGRRQVEVTDADVASPKAGELLTLASGKVRSAVPVTVVTNEESGGKLAVARASPDLPALDGFRRTGQIAVSMGFKAYALSATPPEKAAIARFFSACERK